MHLDLATVLVAAESSPWLQTLGRLHVAIVHFPIALLLIAGAFELWRSLQRSKQASPTAVACLAIGGLTAVASAVLGLIHKDFTSQRGTALTLHLWLGIAAAVVAVLAITALMVSRKFGRSLVPYRVTTIACAALVAATGHYGGNLTHGEGYLTELLTTPGAAVAFKPAADVGVMPVAFPADGKIVFKRDVEPILQHACLECHNPAKQRGELRLDSRDLTLKGGASGPSLVVGKSDQSLIVQHVLGLDGKKRMPVGREPLSDAQVRILKAWIDQGADWPATATIAQGGKKTHWAYVAPTRPEPPAVKKADWVRNPIDAFVLARLEQEGLRPSPEADRTTLIRRLYLDLVGLPPTPEEVDAFVADTDASAYEKLVNRLLASPHYGERWGRHWLDIARYADTNGYEKDKARVIWPYRDWVIGAMNRDMTFDQFVIAQLAGDMLPGATAEDRIATGFHRNTMFNEEGGIDVEEFRYKAVVDRVQTTGTALLGLTVQCAQCHDHKYDDISQKEYFQLFAFLNNADEPYMDVPSAEVTEQRRQIQEKIDTLTGELASKFPARDTSIDWEPVTPDTFATARKSRLVLQPNNALLAIGANPVKDTYTIETELDLTGVNAFRLEALTDSTLPKKGPGRNRNGNFVLSQFKVEHADPGEDVESTPLRIKIDRAEADYSQPDFDVAKCIDDSIDKGWGVGGAEAGKARTATFFTSEKLTGRRRLIITLRQEWKNHCLGRFRLSVGRVPPPPATPPTPQQREQFLAQKLEEWEQSLRSKCTDWTVLEPTKFRRKHGATIHRLGDQSLLFTGDNLYRDEYQLEYAVGDNQKEITALRLEVLPDESQPKNGPGRNPNGGFLLSEFTALAQTPVVAPATRPATTRPVTFASVSAEDSPDTAARAIDGKNNTHWTIPSGGGKPRAAVFKLAEKLPGFEGGTALAVSVVSNYHQSENLGRIRLSATSDPAAGQVSGLPAEIETIVLTPKAQRTGGQNARLREYFLSATPLLAPQHAEIAALKASMPEYTTTLVMQERAVPRVTRIHHRGEFLQPAEPVEPNTLHVLPPFPKDQPKNRLTFARWLMSRENPLVARVVMNRIWSRYFGRGIVNTVEDFGIMGEQPSHPELLDWLATEFVRQHWSMKSMHRLIVTSATYRQSSRLTPELQEKDPVNVLLARGPRFRVEAEVIRDIALAASGLLSDKIGGPSVFPPQPPGISELSYGPMKWVESVGHDRYRRGMYTFLKRTALYPGVTTFDAPTAEVVCAQRVRSNTPLQALTTLNDEVFVEAAQALARRVVENGPSDVAGRAAQVFRLCVARKPDQVELQALVGFYEEQLKRFRGVDGNDDDPEGDKKIDPAAIARIDPKRQSAGLSCDVSELAAWTTVARAVLNLDETVTKE